MSGHTVIKPGSKYSLLSHCVHFILSRCSWEVQKMPGENEGNCSTRWHIGIKPYWVAFLIFSFASWFIWSVTAIETCWPADSGKGRLVVSSGSHIAQQVSKSMARESFPVTSELVQESTLWRDILSCFSQTVHSCLELSMIIYTYIWGLIAFKTLD